MNAKPELENPLRMSRKKSLLSAGMILLNVAVIIVIAFMEFGGGDGVAFPVLFETLRQGNNYLYLAGAVLLTLGMILLDSIKYMIAIRASEGRAKFGFGYKCGAIGRYYDNITPLAIGGQPFQMHYLTQKKLPAHKALGVVLLVFFMQQFSFLIISPYFLIHGTLHAGTAAYFKILMWVGYFFFAIPPAMIILMTIKPSVAMSAVNFFLKILKKLRILKNTDKLSGRITRSLECYRETIISFWKRKASVIIIFLISAAQFFMLFLIPYFVCRSLGAPQAATVSMFSQMVVIFFAITIIPTPGNSIAAEFGFYALFLNILGASVFFGILLWRFLVFYIYLLQGLAIIVTRLINNAVKAKRYYRGIAAGILPQPAHDSEAAEGLAEGVGGAILGGAKDEGEGTKQQ